MDRQARRVIDRVDRRYRRLTSPWRLLPQLLIIGAQKAGTTSLYRYLLEHPSIVAGKRKEVRYFNARYELGLGWYRSAFPLGRGGTADADASGRITLDASTGYLPHPRAPKRVARDLPGAILVVLLRDPVDRAWSHYRHSVREGHEALSFRDAVAAEESRLEPYYEALRAGRPPGREYSYFSYVSRGRYADQLERWFAAIDRSRFLIETSEALFARPEQVTNDVLAFLGLEPVALSNPRAHNAGARGERMAPGDRAALEAIFAPHNQRLYRLLGWEPVWG